MQRSHTIYLRDPATMQFEYQTFGRIENYYAGRAVGYVSLGNVYHPDAQEKFSANYEGLAMGTYKDYATGNFSEVLSQLTGQVNYDHGAGSMSLQTSNSYIAPNNLMGNLTEGVVGSGQDIHGNGQFYYRNMQRDNRFDLNVEMKWSAEDQAFIRRHGSNSITAIGQLYGDKHQEIGGSFQERFGEEGIYKAGFGARDTNQPVSK